MIRKIISAQDTPTLVTVFKEFILKAYGEKSPDGKRLMKSKEIAEAFAQTEAYSELFMSLATDADKAAAFITRCCRSRWSAPLHSLRRQTDNEGNGG